MIWDFPYSCRLSSQSQSSLLRLWWSRYLWLHYCVVDIFFVLVESDESRLVILPFFSLPPFCLFCYHCSLSLYFAKYGCTFRSSVLFCFITAVSLQFIGEFLFMCRMCCETQFVWANYQLCTLRVGLISWIYFLYSWQVAGTWDPPENLARETRAQKYPKSTPLLRVGISLYMYMTGSSDKQNEEGKKTHKHRAKGGSSNPR